MNFKNLIRIFISILFLFSLFSCKSNDNQVKEDEVQEENTEVVNKELDGIIFENIPANVDILKLKEELENFFNYYENIVIEKKYEEWYNILTDKYIAKYSDTEYYANNEKLLYYGITDIESYFYKVVHKARVTLNNGKPLRMNKISFRKGDINKAKILIKYQDKNLYYFFIRENDKWKLGLPEEFYE